MTSATVATKPAAAQSGQSQAKPEKIRKDHSINWWLTAAVAVLSVFFMRFSVKSLLFCYNKLFFWRNLFFV